MVKLTIVGRKCLATSLKIFLITFLNRTSNGKFQGNFGFGYRENIVYKLQAKVDFC